MVSVLLKFQAAIYLHWVMIIGKQTNKQINKQTNGTTF